jgi:hypothetical protein
MNDNELITMVRESVADVHAATPVEQIVGRGRKVRARRRVPLIAGVLAAAAGTAVAVGMVQPVRHPASGSPDIHLAAWTVAKQPNGDIDVTINQLNDPAGLQSLLRADGLPVTVSFSGAPLSSSCQPYDSTRDVLSAVAQWNTSDGSSYLVIHPSALPSGTGIAITDRGGLAPHAEPAPGTEGTGAPPPAGITGPLQIGLVYASQACTG